jgi:hypothetical protein
MKKPICHQHAILEPIALGLIGELEAILEPVALGLIGELGAGSRKRDS